MLWCPHESPRPPMILSSALAGNSMWARIHCRLLESHLKLSACAFSHSAPDPSSAAGGAYWSNAGELVPRGQTLANRDWNWWIDAPLSFSGLFWEAFCTFLRKCSGIEPQCAPRCAWWWPLALVHPPLWLSQSLIPASWDQLPVNHLYPSPTLRLCLGKAQTYSWPPKVNYNFL